MRRVGDDLFLDTIGAGGAAAPGDDCWGCGREPGVDGSLGTACRRQLAERRTDPTTPRLNEMIAKLEDVYQRLCWNCRAELATAISGLCPDCESVLRP